jgi:hypothetical protein
MTLEKMWSKIQDKENIDPKIKFLKFNDLILENGRISWL